MKSRRAEVRLDGQPCGVLDAQAAVLAEASSLIDRCFLPAEQKVQFQQLIKERSAQLRPTAE